MKFLEGRFAKAPEGTAALFFIQIFSTLGFAVFYSTLVLYATKHLHLNTKVATTLMGVFGAFNYGLHLFGVRGLGDKDDKGRQVVIERPQAVRGPGPQAGPAAQDAAGVHLTDTADVVEAVGVAAADHRDVVHASGDLRIPVAHPGP